MKILQPLGDNLVLEPIEVKKETASGIVLPDTAAKKSKMAKVVGVGKDAKGVSIGDMVVYKDFAGHEVEIEGKEYLVISVSDVLAVVVEGEEVRK